MVENRAALMDDSNKQKKIRPASHRIIQESSGRRYQFHCDLSGATVCTTEPFKIDDAETELATAWENFGRANFNYCHKCGKWVIDAMYNADVCTCVQCTPWENLRSLYCKYCGARVHPGEVVCRECQKRWYY